MAAYMIIELEVVDEDAYAEYKARVPATIAQYGGKYLVRGGSTTPLEGGWEPARIVVLEFESLERLRAWNESPEYAQVAPIRERAARTKSIAVEGV